MKMSTTGVVINTIFDKNATAGSLLKVVAAVLAVWFTTWYLLCWNRSSCGAVERSTETNISAYSRAGVQLPGQDYGSENIQPDQQTGIYFDHVVRWLLLSILVAFYPRISLRFWFDDVPNKCSKLYRLLMNLDCNGLQDIGFLWNIVLPPLHGGSQGCTDKYPDRAGPVLSGSVGDIFLIKKSAIEKGKKSAFEKK